MYTETEAVGFDVYTRHAHISSSMEHCFTCALRSEEEITAAEFGGAIRCPACVALAGPEPRIWFVCDGGHPDDRDEDELLLER
jgi:hypothetical protein